MLKEKITNDLKEAMKRGDSAVVSVLRMALAAIRNKEIEKRTENLPDEDAGQILATEARKRKEAIASFEGGGRTELAEKEKAELAIIKTYLPEEATEDEIRGAVKDAIVKTDAKGPKDMGKVMGVAMGALKGRADGAMVRKAVTELLGA